MDEVNYVPVVSAVGGFNMWVILVSVVILVGVCMKWEGKVCGCC